MTFFYWDVRGAYADVKRKLAEMPREALEHGVINDHYNDFLADRADFKDGEPDPRGHGKRLPYIGWFWRSLTFSHPERIPIGDCGDFIGFMANNKWDYPERRLTAEEFSKVIAFIDESIRESQAGGEMNSIIEKTNKPLADLWDYLQTLSI